MGSGEGSSEFLDVILRCLYLGGRQEREREREVWGWGGGRPREGQQTRECALSALVCVMKTLILSWGCIFIASSSPHSS